MQHTRGIVALGRKLREDHKLKVRQPSRLTVVHREQAVRDAIFAHQQLVQDELNIKNVAADVDEAAFAHSSKPNFRACANAAPTRSKISLRY